MSAKFGTGVILPLAAVLVGAAPPAGRAGVEGRWLTDDGKGIVSIAKCGAKLCGTLVRVLDPAAPAHDLNNPDTSARGRPLVGTQILWGLAPVANGGKGGQVYDPKAGAVYRAKIELGRDNRLAVTGCVLFVCQSRYWTRAPEENL